VIRWFILPQTPDGYTLPEQDSEVTYLITDKDMHIEQRTIVVEHVRYPWGTNGVRIEGKTRLEDGKYHRTIGRYTIGVTVSDTVGILEVQDT
jgi:hypothetical protein